MEWWHVYLFTRLDVVNGLIFSGMVVFGMMAIAAGINLMFEGDLPEIARRHMSKIILAAVVNTLLVVAIPTQKEAAAIYLLPKLAKSDFAKEASKIPTDAAKLMRLKLESWIADMEPKKPATK